VTLRCDDATEISSPLFPKLFLFSRLVGSLACDLPRSRADVSGVLLQTQKQQIHKSKNMKANRTPKLIRSLAAAVGGFALFTGTLPAAPFLYRQGDLALTFRKTGGASDLVVNIGRATNYNALPAGTTITISNLLVSHLATAFAGVNDLAWAVGGANRLGGDPNYPIQTLWVTRARLDSSTQSNPWLRKSQFDQGSTAGQVDGVGAKAATYSGNVASNANNTATAVIIPSNNLDYGLNVIIGNGDYDGSFQGNVQNLTASDFDSDFANVSRSDLYELLPGNDTPGRYLGYFEFQPDGTLTFNTIAPPPPRPTITNIIRVGNVTTVSLTTTASATYRLRYTDAAGLATPVSTWNIGSSLSGTGSVLPLSDTNSGDSRFYAVDAQ
jgi:hypothetical protein